ncbi:hypothetical protein KIK84_01320 [Curvibacter sp. CHRR-16]|uniref:hypothetical protein n=1 Tax=Curvibacter sp. CHRR-16 TaxID=2835872 RepID=UPI001BDA2B2F|nr:hypothetical protein [Curvibacter sp. CHRR-16]MBT0568954.1 hypothetical protein [Curvibacter sp. CHRR-16]
MKKQILSLRGKSGVGKSTTLHLLYKLLLAYPNAKPLSFKSIGRKLDFIATLEIEGHVVGIFNRGDLPEIVQELLEQLEAEKCQVIVCAARTKGEVEKVFQSFKRRYKLVDVPKRVAASQSYTASNHLAAYTLASLVCAAVGA